MGYLGKYIYIKLCDKPQMQYNNIPWGEQEAEELQEDEVDPEPGRQLEDVQVDWDTGEKKIRLCKKYPGALYQHTMAAGAGAWP